MSSSSNEEVHFGTETAQGGVSRVEPSCEATGEFAGEPSRSVVEQAGGIEARWQDSLKRAIRTPGELLKELSLSESDVSFSLVGENQFPIFVTREFVSRMVKGDPRDPLFLQVWPTGAESQILPGDSKDAVGELGSEAIPGLLHKYHGRVLLIASGACAIHCRYCFRRHFPYETAPKGGDSWEPAMKLIEADSSIVEVILSGGDPLSLVDSSVKHLVERIEKIPHVKRLRIHTRLPVVIPSRVTVELVNLLSRTRLAVWFVLHINHGNEIDTELSHAVRRLRASGAVLLNQSVLLKGVNDDLETQEQLLGKLIDLQIVPYYLHQIDRVEGASHWEVGRDKGRELVSALRARLPGFAIPLYVKEDSEAPSKTPL